MIKLKTIDKNNWELCTTLKPKQDQEHFIAPNVYSIAEAQFLNGFSSMAIYKEEDMIGYTLFGLDPDDNNYWIYRFMIDERYQGKGYGLNAVQLVIDEIRNRNDRSDVIILGYNPGNERARKLYLKTGFIEEGLAQWGEMITRYKFA